MGYLEQFEPDELQATSLETAQNGPDEAALYAVWLDDDQGAFHRHAGMYLT